LFSGNDRHGLFDVRNQSAGQFVDQWFVTGLQRSRRSFLSRLCAAYRNGMALQFTIPRFLSINRTTAAKYRKATCMQSRQLTNRSVLLQATLSQLCLGGLRFGFSICYDLRFPEMYRKLAVEQNVGAFIVSSAWPFPRIGISERLSLRAQ